MCILVIVVVCVQLVVMCVLLIVVCVQQIVVCVQLVTMCVLLAVVYIQVVVVCTGSSGLSPASIVVCALLCVPLIVMWFLVNELNQFAM